MLRALALAATLLFASAAHAQDAAPATPELINADARYVELDGPGEGEKRGVYIWRAPSTPSGVPLPTLYMADGGPGVYVAAARLRAEIEAGRIPPVQIIGLGPDIEHRRAEYAEPGRSRFRAYERWVLEVVIPWAERVARASPTQRAIGGYSNGADFALAMGRLHPGVFSGVLAHSPVSPQAFNLDQRASRTRWAFSAGRGEYNGAPLAFVTMAAAEVRGDGGVTRICSGNWEHGPEAWIELSPGAIAWLFDFPNADSSATPLERENCR